MQPQNTTADNIEMRTVGPDGNSVNTEGILL